MDTVLLGYANRDSVMLDAKGRRFSPNAAPGSYSGFPHDKDHPPAP